MNEWLTPKEVAAHLAIDRLTVYRMVRDGRLPASRVGNRGLRIQRDAVVALLRPVETADGRP